MAQQRRRPQAPNSIPVAPEPEEIVIPDEREEELVELGEAVIVDESKSVATDVGVVETKEQPQPGPHLVAVPNGVILKQDEPVTIDGLDMGQYVIVKRDIYREVYPRGTRRPSYILLYSRGEQVLKSTLVKK